MRSPPWRSPTTPRCHDGRASARARRRRSLSMTNETTRREFLRAAGAAGAAIGVSWAPGAKAAGTGALTIRQDWIHGGHHAAMWVALDKGWYTEKGLTVTIVRGFGSAD